MIGKKETVREFINKKSCAAWVAFDFEADGRSFYCHSIEDFILDYGRRSSYILDDYIVISTKESYLSNSQGQTIWMTLMKKSDYVETLKPITLSPLDVEDIIKKLENVKIKLNDYASGYEEAERDIDSIIKILEE